MNIENQSQIDPHHSPDLGHIAENRTSRSTLLINRAAIVSGICFLLALFAGLIGRFIEFTFIAGTYLGLGAIAFGLFKFGQPSRPERRLIKTLQILFWLFYAVAAVLLVRFLFDLFTLTDNSLLLFWFFVIMVCILLIQTMMTISRPLPRFNGLPIISILFWVVSVPFSVFMDYNFWITLIPSLFIPVLEYDLVFWFNLVGRTGYCLCWLLIIWQLIRHQQDNKQFNLAITLQPISSWWTFFRLWVVVSIIGWILLLPLQFLLPLFHSGSTTLSGSVFVLIGLLLVGLGMAASQWFVLRLYLSHAIWWIPATLAGVVLGVALSRLTMPQYGFFVDPYEEWDYYAIVGYDLLFVYPCVAVLQAVVLWFTGRWRALLWIPVKGVALLLSSYAAPIGWLAGYLDWPMEILFQFSWLLTCLFPLAGVLFALATGWYLQWLLGLRSATPASAEDAAEPKAAIM